MVPMPGACKNAREGPSRRLGRNVESASAARLINTSWYDTPSSLVIVPQTRVANRRSPGIPRAGASFCPGQRAELAQILRIQVSAQSRSSGSGSSACRYRWFESISLQQTVRLSPDFALVPGKARVLRRYGGEARQYGRQRRAKSSNIALRSGNVSVGHISVPQCRRSGSRRWGRRRLARLRRSRFSGIDKA